MPDATAMHQCNSQSRQEASQPIDGASQACKERALRIVALVPCAPLIRHTRSAERMHAVPKGFPKRMQNQQDQKISKSRSGSSSQTLRKTHTSRSEQHETDEGDDGTVEVELNVRGMKCDGCRSSVEQALLSVASVDNVSVDIDSGKAIVSVKARTLHCLLKTATLLPLPSRTLSHCIAGAYCYGRLPRGHPPRRCHLSCW